MYSLHAHSFIKNTVLSLWNTNINFSYINIGQKTYWEIHTFYEVWILISNRHSTGKMLTRLFCRVCLFLHLNKWTHHLQMQSTTVVTRIGNPFSCWCICTCSSITNYLMYLNLPTGLRVRPHMNPRTKDQSLLCISSVPCWHERHKAPLMLLFNFIMCTSVPVLHLISATFMKILFIMKPTEPVQVLYLYLYNLHWLITEFILY